MTTIEDMYEKIGDQTKIIRDILAETRLDLNEIKIATGITHITTCHDQETPIDPNSKRKLAKIVMEIEGGASYLPVASIYRTD